MYNTDISKFDPKLSNDLFWYYDNLTSAEADREYLQNYIDSHPEIIGSNGYPDLEGQYFVAYMDMRCCINNAAKLTPTILSELEAAKQ